MSRAPFGSWGADLDEAAFASALAGAMVGARATDARTHTVRAVSPLRGDGPKADAARAAWERHAGTPARFEVPIALVRRMSVEPRWLLETLRRAPGVASVVFVEPRASVPHRPWSWPVDVGSFDDAASRALRAAMEAQYWQRFVRFVDAEQSRGHIDLLLLPAGLAIPRPRQSQLPPVHTVLGLGGVPRGAEPLGALAKVRTEAGALCAGALEVSQADANGWLDRVLNHLSHDLCLDEVLFAAQDVGAPLLVSPPGAFADAHAARVVERMAASRKKMSKRPVSEIVPADLLARAGVPSAAPLDEVIRSLPQHTDRIGWGSESGAASLAAAVAGAEPDDASSEAEAGPRFVQARLLVAGRDVSKAPVVPGAVHRLDVRVGLPSLEWASAPAALRTDLLPASEAGHVLTVVLTAPALLDAPRAEKLLLPARGSSEPCSFELAIPADVRAIDARITVLFENRILQTLRIRSDEGGPLRIALESALRASLEELDGATGFDASFLLNDHEGGKGIVTFAGDDVAYVRLKSVEALRDNLRDQLELVTKAPKDYADPASEPTRTLYVTIARAGSLFKKRLGELPGMKAALGHVGQDPARIQVMSLDPDDVVPLELVYDAPYPKEDAVLCAGLRDRVPCGPGCGAGPGVVCGLGFWGTRHVIERRLYDETIASALQDKGAEHAIGASPSSRAATLRPLENVVFASSDRAASFDAPAFAAEVQAIEAAFAAANRVMVRAKDWDDWESQIATVHPELLLLITHTEERAGDAAMEIGDSKFLSSGELGPSYVGPVKEEEPGPIVLLLGCRTADEEVPFASLVSAFRQAHASVVLGTLSTVRGRHMAPVARAAVEHLLAHAKGPGVRFGEVVRDLRRSLLQRGLPVGLALVSFGEVDWKIGGTA